MSENKKLVFVSHPLRGNIRDNIQRIAQIIRAINLTEPDVIPIAPYVADALALDDSKDAERNRAISNGLYLLNALAPQIAEMRLYGPFVTPGMAKERAEAERLGMPVMDYTDAAGTTKVNAFSRRYSRWQDVANVLPACTEVKDLAKLYYVNSELVEAHPELKAKFTTKKNELFEAGKILPAA